MKTLTLGEITEVIHRCNSLEDLQKVEDYVLTYMEDFNSVEITCMYTFLGVKNNILYDIRVVSKKLYKN